MFNLTTDFYLHIYKAQCFRLLRAHSFCFVSTKKYEKIREDTQKKIKLSLSGRTTKVQVGYFPPPPPLKTLLVHILLFHIFL